MTSSARDSDGVVDEANLLLPKCMTDIISWNNYWYGLIVWHYNVDLVADFWYVGYRSGHLLRFYYWAGQKVHFQLHSQMPSTFVQTRISQQSLISLTSNPASGIVLVTIIVSLIGPTYAYFVVGSIVTMYHRCSPTLSWLILYEEFSIICSDVYAPY
jgi:hypothetical protein